MQSPLYYDELAYRLVKDCDPTAREIANRHYSRQWKGTPESQQFVGPGVPMVILGVDSDWLFIWRLARHRDDGQTGVECSLFHNASRRIASDLVLISEAAWDRSHGPTRKFTYVNEALIKPQKYGRPRPGYCFEKAGWIRSSERSKVNNLVLLYKEAV